jgi:hypothetical protein
MEFDVKAGGVDCQVTLLEYMTPAVVAAGVPKGTLDAGGNIPGA